jgi:hypothetical protein
MAGGFGPPRPKDITSQEALRTRFFPDASLESLQPTLTMCRRKSRERRAI